LVEEEKTDNEKPQQQEHQRTRDYKEDYFLIVRKHTKEIARDEYSIKLAIFDMTTKNT
jgi:hypothetical protein